MKYIIVGAGISGLSIGQVLKEYGHDVQLFEADSRPGGMVECDRVHGLEDMSLTQNVRMYWIGFGVILTKKTSLLWQIEIQLFQWLIIP